MAAPLKANVINHVVFVLDESESMNTHKQALIRVADGEIAHLAERSKELAQETRVSIYTFSYGTNIRCVIFDMDVLRLPSIAEFYRPNGLTALASATVLAYDDLGQTFQKYGDHAFLMYVLTDGMENDSSYADRAILPKKIANRPDNWSMGFLVPDEKGVGYATKIGIPRDSVTIWNAQSATGMTEVGSVLREATERFMQGRAKGVRGTQSVFSTGADAVNRVTVMGTLTPLRPESYMLVPVPMETAIRPFVEEQCGLTYTVGMAYYQLNKTETIQSQKPIAVVEKATGKAYSGPQARDLIGLPSMTVRVRPSYNADYDIFVQSTSVNRKLIPGTRLLLLTGN